MAINTDMNGVALDFVLKQFYDAQNTDNNGMIIYINQGELAFEDGAILFDVTELEPET